MSASSVSMAEISPSRHGVITLYGYGISVRVDRGHLVLQDGIAADRREARLARVGHGLKRLVVIGSDGMVSLSALRWLADQDAAFVSATVLYSPQLDPCALLTRDSDVLKHSQLNLIPLCGLHESSSTRSSPVRNTSHVRSCSILQLQTQSLNSGLSCPRLTVSQRFG